MKKTYAKQFNNKLQANAYYNKVRQNEKLRFATCSFNLDQSAWVVIYQFA